MSFRGGSQGKVAIGILGGAVALLYVSTFMEVRDIKKTEGNIRVHAGQKRPDYISPEAQAAVTHPHADVGSKDK